jgi:hypothetical protein
LVLGAHTDTLDNNFAELREDRDNFAGLTFVVAREDNYGIAFFNVKGVHTNS